LVSMSALMYVCIPIFIPSILSPNIIILPVTNHILIGALHIFPGLIGGPTGIGSSSTIRLELALPGHIPSPNLQHNPCITFHGILTISLMIMPLLIGGFGNLPIPSMTSPTDMIFPRPNALSS